MDKIKTNNFSAGSISPLRNGFHQSRKLVDQVGQQPQIDKKEAKQNTLNNERTTQNAKTFQR